jgi:hypothetical protein
MVTANTKRPERQNINLVSVKRSGMNYMVKLNDQDSIDEAIESVRYYGVWYVMTVAKEWEHRDLGMSLT